MYTRNSQSAVTSDEDRGDKSTLPREVSSEKKKEKKKAREPADVASACSPCLNTVRGILASPSSSSPPILSLFHENQANLIFRLEKKKKRKWISDIENGSALVTTLIPKSRRMLINFQRITLERVFLLGMYTYMIRESSSKAFPN